MRKNYELSPKWQVKTAIEPEMRQTRLAIGPKRIKLVIEHEIMRKTRNWTQNDKKTIKPKTKYLSGNENYNDLLNP